MTTATELTEIFNDNFVSYFRAHVAHVNVTGRQFASDHALLGEIYESRQSQIDVIGELLRTLNELMPNDLSVVAEDSHIDVTELAGDADFLLNMIKEDLEHLCEHYKELVVTAEDEDESQIANYAQEQILVLTKQLWKLNATLGDSEIKEAEESDEEDSTQWWKPDAE